MHQHQSSIDLLPEEETLNENDPYFGGNHRDMLYEDHTEKEDELGDHNQENEE